MAGVLTAYATGGATPGSRARALGRSAGRSRRHPRHTAFLVADLVDNVVLGEPRAFTRMASCMITDAGNDDPDAS